jgi:hypothetical protein
MTGDVAARRTAAEAASRREEMRGWGETEFELAAVALTAAGRSPRRREGTARAKGLRMEDAPARKAMTAARVCGAEITKLEFAGDEQRWREQRPSLVWWSCGENN